MGAGVPDNGLPPESLILPPLDSGSPLEAAFGRLLFFYLRRPAALFIPAYTGPKGVSLKNACIAVLLALYALTGHAAEKKWSKLEGCRYVAGKYNDGDSFSVQCGQEKFYVRLYFVDSPEVDLSSGDRVRLQYEYFGVTTDELTRAGGRAADLVRDKLSGKPFVIQTRKAHAPGRGKSTRYYSLVQVEGKYLHEILLSEGLARNKGTRVALPGGAKAQAHADALQGLEDRAKAARKGLWATHDPSKVKSPF